MSFLLTFAFSESHHRADGFALVHEVESVIDLLERHDVRDQVVDVDFLVHIPVDELRHVGASACPAECRPLPHPPGHQLERTCLDLLPGARNTDDHRYPPAAMAA